MFETHVTQNTNNNSQRQENKTKIMVSFREVWNGGDNEQSEMFEEKTKNI